MFIHRSYNKKFVSSCLSVIFTSFNMDEKQLFGLCFGQLSEKRHGIIRFSKNGMSPQNYSFIRPARFGERYSLFLTSVTPEDSGSYECAISANVGGQNQNLQVNLIVHGEL